MRWVRNRETMKMEWMGVVRVSSWSSVFKRRTTGDNTNQWNSWRKGKDWWQDRSDE